MPPTSPHWSTQLERLFREPPVRIELTTARLQGD
jgi:hypothetical protein